MKHTRVLSLIFALALALGLCACGAASSAPASSAPVSSAAQQTVVHATFTIIYADETSKEFALECAEGETLAVALEKAGLISADEAADGFVTVVDGVEAKWEVDKGWWQLMDAAGRSAMKGIGQLTLAEAEGYAFVYTID